jgi:hypothetical protein
MPDTQRAHEQGNIASDGDLYEILSRPLVIQGQVLHVTFIMGSKR